MMRIPGRIMANTPFRESKRGDWQIPSRAGRFGGRWAAAPAAGPRQIRGKPHLGASNRPPSSAKWLNCASQTVILSRPVDAARRLDLSCRAASNKFYFPVESYAVYVFVSVATVDLFYCKPCCDPFALGDSVPRGKRPAPGCMAHGLPRGSRRGGESPVAGGCVVLRSIGQKGKRALRPRRV